MGGGGSRNIEYRFKAHIGRGGGGRGTNGNLRERGEEGGGVRD